MTDRLEMIKAEASRIEEDALHAARGHWEAAKPWDRRHLWLGIPTTIFAAAAGVTAFTEHPYLSGGFDIAVAVGTALLTLINPTERHRRHADAGNAYKALNNEARIFRSIDCAVEADDEALAARLKELNQRRNDLNHESPLVPSSAAAADRR